MAPGRLSADLAAALDRLAAEPERRLLGVAGLPEAGKTTFTEAVLTHLGERAGHCPMDGFHLADAQLDRLGLRARKGAPETFDVRGYAATLRRLRDERSHDVFVPGFERDLEQPLAAALVVHPSARLVVTEGNYLLLDGPWQHVRRLLDEVWLVDAPEPRRVAQLVARHVLHGKSPEAARRWVEQVDEPNARLVAARRERADRIVTWADGQWRLSR